MGPLSRSSGRRQTMLLVTLALVVTACSGDATESEEYLELQSELAAQVSETETIQSELDDSRAREAELSSEVESVRSDLDDLRAELDEATRRAAETESELDDYLNRPWPAELKDLFVVGCTDGPNEGLTDEEETELCSCMVEELEQTVTLDDFMVFSAIAFAAEGSTDVNPVTGFPSNLDDELVEALLDAGTTCALSLDHRRIFLA